MTPKFVSFVFNLTTSYGKINPFFLLLIAYRREHRQALLEQVRQKEVAQREEYSHKMYESRVVSDLAKPSNKNDELEWGSKSQYLKQFRDQNKKVYTILYIQCSLIISRHK